MLSVNARQIVWRIINSAYGTTAEVSVCVEGRSGTYSVAQSVAQSVVHRKFYHQVVQTACCGVAQILCINSRQGIGRVVAAAHGDTSQMSVGVEGSSGTYSVAQSVAQSVVHRQKYSQIMLMAGSVVGNGKVINTVDIETHAKRVENLPTAEISVNSIGCCIYNREVDNEIHKTAGGSVAQVLCVNSRGCVWRIINATYRQIAHVSVSIKNVSGADNRMNGVAKGVAHEKVDIQHTVASAYGFQSLAIHSRCRQGVAVFDISGTGADDGVNILVGGIAHKPMVVRNPELAAGVVDKRNHAVILIGVEIYRYRTIVGEGMYGIPRGIPSVVEPHRCRKGGWRTPHAGAGAYLGLGARQSVVGVSEMVVGSLSACIAR